MQVAVAKRRAKRVAGAAMHYAADLGWWQVILYSIADEKIAPIGASHFASQEEAIADANEPLKVAASDPVEVCEADV